MKNKQMKKLIAISIIGLLVSCNNSNSEKETSKTTTQLKETKSEKPPKKIVLTESEMVKTVRVYY